MKFNLIDTKLGGAIKKNAPTITFAFGIGLVLGGTISAIVQATKLNDELEEPIQNLKMVHDRKQQDPDGYSDQEYTVDLIKSYGMVGLTALKLFAVPLAIELGGVVLLTKSHTMILKENASWALGYATLDQAYRKLDSSIKANTDEETYDRIVRGIEHEEHIVETVDENGVVRTDTVDAAVVNEEASCNPYAVFFDPSSSEWEDSPEYNKSFLIGVQDRFNRLLRSRETHVVFWNEILNAIDVPQTVMGQHVGWHYDASLGDSHPDNNIDLGLTNVYRKATRRFMNGLEPIVLIEPNIHGEVINYL